MTLDHAAKFLTDLLNGIKIPDLPSHFAHYCSENIVGHYQAQDFNYAGLLEQARNIISFIEKFHFEIDDLVVIDGLVISVVRFSWVHSSNKSYYEAILNLVFKVDTDKIKEIWLMLDQKGCSSSQQQDDFQKILKRFEINEKDKIEFLRRLSINQSLYRNQEKPLNDTEKECLFYYLNGFSSKEAARAMGLSYRTIEIYLASIKSEFGCSTKMELRNALFPQETPWGEKE